MKVFDRFVNKLNRIRLQPNLSGGERLILHTGQHKVMTSYFNNILYNLCVDFDWEFHKFFEKADFEKALQNCLSSRKINVICCYNFAPDLNLISTTFKGSNIIRDPRDMLVSGYNYHLWTDEEWACLPMVEEHWERLQLKNRFSNIGVAELRNMSYKELLNRLDDIEGYLLELDLRAKHIANMAAWDYSNPAILELKYENVFQKEEDTFSGLFEHYGFSPSMIQHGMKYVREFSFENMKKKGEAGMKKHASTGKSSQWKDKLPSEVVDVFNARHAVLLEQLGYE